MRAEVTGTRPADRQLMDDPSNRPLLGGGSLQAIQAP